MLPLRHRVVPLLGVLLGAPVTAEYLYAYLPFTGDAWRSLVTIVFFAPLYGGAALLIREIAVRTRRGWVGVLLLATTFGIAMPGLVDLALFGQDRADVAFWSELREPTLIPALGFSGFPLLSWTLGHVMMSIGAPLALLHALAPTHRGRPLLGRVGIPLTVVVAALIVVVVHQDGRQTYDYAPSLAQAVSVLVVVAVVAGLAFTRLGTPVRTTPGGRTVPAFAVVGGAMVLKLSTDLLPPTWPGAVSLVVILSLGGAPLAWCARHCRWGPREIDLLGAGVVVAGALAGFASPLPEGVTLTAKLAHSGVLLALALVVMALTLRRTSEIITTPHGARTGR